MQILNLMNIARNSANPMGILESQLGNNPMYSRALDMCKGKSNAELEQIALNIANQKGIDLNAIRSQIGF